MNGWIEYVKEGTEWRMICVLAEADVVTAAVEMSLATTNDWEVSVCDYGSTDTDWDNTALFDIVFFSGFCRPCCVGNEKIPPLQSL